MYGGQGLPTASQIHAQYFSKKLYELPALGHRIRPSHIMSGHHHTLQSDIARPAIGRLPLPGLRRRSTNAMALQPGQRALDVGCGTGNSTLALADVVGGNGVVHGVDYDLAMIAEAQRRAAIDGLDSWVTYHQANAAALPWPDGYFDASHSDRVLQHMLDPVCAFGELVRVTRNGGRVVVIDGDWATLNIDSDDPENDGRLAYFQETLQYANPASGHCLYQLFADHGLLDIELDVLPVFERNADAASCWQQSRTLFSALEGRFASANVVLISGRKP